MRQPRPLNLPSLKTTLCRFSFSLQYIMIMYTLMICTSATPLKRPLTENDQLKNFTGAL